MWELVIVVVLIIYVIFTYKAWIYIDNNNILSKKQKLINSILIWIIPFLWFLLIKSLTNFKSEAMTKTKREELNKKSGGFTESGTGIWGS